MIQGLVQLYWRWRAWSARRTLSHFDELLKKAKYTRHERRQFWKDFIRSNGGIITGKEGQ